MSEPFHILEERYDVSVDRPLFVRHTIPSTLVTQRRGTGACAAICVAHMLEVHTKVALSASMLYALRPDGRQSGMSCEEALQVSTTHLISPPWIYHSWKQEWYRKHPHCRSSKCMRRVLTNETASDSSSVPPGNVYRILTLNGLCYALAMWGPCVVVSKCYNQGNTFWRPGPADPPAAAEFHAFLVVGYDDRTESIQYRNTWGKDWGDEGYSSFPYADVQDNLLEMWSVCPFSRV